MSGPVSPADLVIEPLAKQHDLKQFRCGETALDDYLRRHARISTLAGYGRTYVAIQPGHARVWAFYTLATASVDVSSLPVKPESSPRHLPVILLARFAVDSSLQSMGIGRMLMVHCFKISLEVADRAGVHALVVYAKNSRVGQYYQRFGFMPLTDDPLHLFLPIAVLREARDQIT
jgi:predicted N-acetyltransferase YhbS